MFLKSRDLWFILCTGQYQRHHICSSNLVLTQGFSHVFGLETQRELCLDHGDFTLKQENGSYINQTQNSLTVSIPYMKQVSICSTCL